MIKEVSAGAVVFKDDLVLIINLVIIVYNRIAYA